MPTNAQDMAFNCYLSGHFEKLSRRPNKENSECPPTLVVFPYVYTSCLDRMDTGNQQL